MVFKSWTEQNLDVCEFEALMVPTNHSLPRQNRCAFRATEAESGELPPADEKKESQVGDHLPSQLVCLSWMVPQSQWSHWHCVLQSNSFFVPTHLTGFRDSTGASRPP